MKKKKKKNRLGVTYNALPGQYRKDEFEKWARDEYSDVWQKLVNRNTRKETIKGRMFDLERGFEA